MARHSWGSSDDDSPDLGAGHDWGDSGDDEPGGGYSGSDSDESLDFDNMTKTRATHEFMELLLSAYFDT